MLHKALLLSLRGLAEGCEALWLAEAPSSSAPQCLALPVWAYLELGEGRVIEGSGLLSASLQQLCGAGGAWGVVPNSSDCHLWKCDF